MRIPRKTRKRVLALLLSVLRQVGVPVLGLITSSYALRVGSLAIWGHFAGMYLWIALAEQVTAWGGQGLLMQRATSHPNRLVPLWWRWLVARLPLLGLSLLALLAVPGIREQFGTVLLWLCAAYVYRSFEFMVNWRRAFGFTLVAEALGTTFVLAGLHFISPLDRGLLVQLFAAAAAIKALCGLLWFRPFPPRLEPDARGLLGAGFWFFVPGILGLLHARVDLYVVALSLDQEKVGFYHLLSNLLIQGQTAAVALLAPFLRAFLRADRQLINAYRHQAWRWGLICTPLLTALIAVIMAFFYRAPLAPALWPIVALQVFPFFVYLIDIQELMRRRHSRQVALVGGLGVLWHLALNLLAVPYWGVAGALLSATISQYLIWLAYARAVRATAVAHG